MFCFCIKIKLYYDIITLDHTLLFRKLDYCTCNLQSHVLAIALKWVTFNAVIQQNFYTIIWCSGSEARGQNKRYLWGHKMIKAKRKKNIHFCYTKSCLFQTFLIRSFPFSRVSKNPTVHIKHKEKNTAHSCSYQGHKMMRITSRHCLSKVNSDHFMLWMYSWDQFVRSQSLHNLSFYCKLC